MKWNTDYDMPTKKIHRNMKQWVRYMLSKSRTMSTIRLSLRWRGFYNKWLEHYADLYLVDYEDIVKDPVQTIKQISEWINIGVDDDRINYCVEGLRIDKAKQRAIKKGLNNITIGSNKVHLNFIERKVISCITEKTKAKLDKLNNSGK